MHSCIFALVGSWYCINVLCFYFQTCTIALLACLIFSTTLYALIVVPPGGFHFNINGLLVCEPYFISNNVLALAACLFYFPTTMILMYCYGTIFHSDKVKVRYKKAVLTSLPFVRAGDEENASKMAERVRLYSICQQILLLHRVHFY